jgi:hypothetical protein
VSEQNDETDERSAESVARANRIAGMAAMFQPGPVTDDMIVMPGAFKDSVDMPLTWGQGGPVIGHATVKADGTGLFQLSEPSARYPRAEPTPEELPERMIRNSRPDQRLTWLADQLLSATDARAGFGLGQPFLKPAQPTHDAATCPECRAINGAAQEGVATIAKYADSDVRHDRSKTWLGRAVVTFAAGLIATVAADALGADPRWLVDVLGDLMALGVILAGLGWVWEHGYRKGRTSGLAVMTTALTKIDEMMAAAFPGSRGITFTDFTMGPDGKIVETEEKRLKDEG